MNLAIDIGNTLAKLAIIDGGQVVDFLKTEQIDTAYIEKLLKANPGIDAAVIVSSRDTDEELERFLEQRMKRYDLPDQRYPDRRFRNGHYDRRRLGRRIPRRQHHPRRGDPFQSSAPLHEKTAAVLAER